MQAVLKSFRLPKEMADFIKNEALLNHVSEARVIERAIAQIMNRQDQYKKDLMVLAADPEMKAEMELLSQIFEDDADGSW